MKKKLSSLVISIILGLSLAACGGNPTAPTVSPSATPSITVTAPQASETLPINNSGIKEFPLAYDGTVSSLNDSLSASGYAQLSNPKVSPGETKELGIHTAYTYSLGTGAALVLYVSDSTGNVLNFSVLTIASEITDETADTTAFLIGCLEGGLAGEDSERIASELNINMDNLTEDTLTTASTELADFLYIVQDGSLVFMATPV